MSAAVAKRGRDDRDPGLVLQLRPVEGGDLADLGQVERARDRVDLVVPDSEAGLEAFHHRLRGRRGDLDAHSVAEAAAAQLELDRLEQVVCLVGDLEVGVTGHAEDGALGDLHLREEPGEEVRDHALEGYEQAALSHLDEARHPLRDLHAREALFARLGVDDEDGQAERERRDVRKGLARPHRERREDREDIPVER